MQHVVVDCMVYVKSSNMLHNTCLKKKKKFQRCSVLFLCGGRGSVLLSLYPLMLFTCLIFVAFCSLQECQFLCFCAAGVSKKHLVFFFLGVVNFFLSFIIGKSSVSFCASFIFRMCPGFFFFHSFTMPFFFF